MSEFFIEIHALYCTIKKQKTFPILIKVRASTAPVIEERPQVPTHRSHCLIIFLCLQGCCSQSHCCDWLCNAMELHLGQFLLLALCDQAVQLCCAVPNQSLQVTHKFVHKPLALHLADHVSIIVIPAIQKSATENFINYLQFSYASITYLRSPEAKILLFFSLRFS